MDNLLLNLDFKFRHARVSQVNHIIFTFACF